MIAGGVAMVVGVVGFAAGAVLEILENRLSAEVVASESKDLDPSPKGGADQERPPPRGWTVSGDDGRLVSAPAAPGVGGGDAGRVVSRRGDL